MPGTNSGRDSFLLRTAIVRARCCVLTAPPAGGVIVIIINFSRCHNLQFNVSASGVSFLQCRCMFNLLHGFFCFVPGKLLRGFQPVYPTTLCINLNTFPNAFPFHIVFNNEGGSTSSVKHKRCNTDTHKALLNGATFIYTVIGDAFIKKKHIFLICYTAGYFTAVVQIKYFVH